MFRSWSGSARAASLTFLPLVLSALAVSAEAQSSNGDSRVRTREMNGFQEVPSIMTAAVGEFEAKIIDDAAIEYTLSYTGLEGGATLFAHIHFARDGVNGGVMVFLCNGGPVPKPVCPTVSGTVMGVITPADVIGPAGQGVEPLNFADLIRALRTGTAYANVHTTRFPGGEIRGQIRDDRDIKDTP
jgi:hypothetical protein